MLRAPYTCYDRLYVYHLDLPDVPGLLDPDLIGIWTEDGSAILFFHRNKDRLVQEICQANGGSIIYQADLDYQDWEAGHVIAPFTVKGMTIAPVWDPWPATIRLDPSVIFGSGFHPSTRLCLEALLKYTGTPEISIKSALDLGCGTGLLSIAAAKQGVEQVTAIDHNPFACQVAEANITRNQGQDLVTVRQVDLRRQPLNTNVDLVIANLYRELLVHLLSAPTFWQAQMYIIAGFAPGMEPELMAALPASGVKLIERMRQDRWCLWVLART